MKASLTLNIGQQTSLNQQMQQAVKMLQLSSLDLQELIQTELNSNPLLEVDSMDEESEQTAIDAKESLDNDFQWSDLYTAKKSKEEFNENSYIFETLHCSKNSLQDHLRWQLEINSFSSQDQIIALVIIDAIDKNGLLSCSMEDLEKSLSSVKQNFDKKEIEAVLHRIQRFDPIGCGARSLAETLTIQLEYFSADSPHLQLAKDIIRQDLDCLAQHNYRVLIKKYHISERLLSQVLALIQTLHPRPGNLIDAESPEYIIPDLSIKKIDNRWQVFLNQSSVPHLTVNHHYANYIKTANHTESIKTLKQSLHEANWFIKCIQNRQETLLKVARYIVDYQQYFFEAGEQAMKPMILDEVAKALNLHESTISRVTNQKYINTPRGIFELKYFFNSKYATTTGESYSSTQVRAIIKKLIAEENAIKPLSDNQLVKLLSLQGIPIARRTISKYREEMGIAPSYERKSI